MRPTTAIAAALVAAAAALAAPPAPAQQYFGKNQVQYDRFRWKVIETEHFLVHYYPEEETAARDAARMSERAYGRLSRIFQHEFREKKPIIFFASRTDFGQNNVTGDLGEGTGGVTEALRHRILLPFTGDYGSFEQILTHEMVHEFQYDIFARGKAGNGLQTLAQVNPPYWFAEGMAEYLSIGPDDDHANTVMRDGALNGRLPTVEQLTERPDVFNPYDFGQVFWEYIGQRWGDEIIGEIMQSAVNVGIERAFKREIGLSLEDLGDEWKEEMQVRYLPGIANLQRARKVAQPLLTERRSGGQIFLAPTLSDDGKHIAFLSNGSFLRGEVFIDLWLADARSGKRIKRLVKSTTNPDVEELRILYSQASFSPDGKRLAYVGQRKGKDVLYILDVASRKNVRRIDTPELEGVTSPSWSPDGQRIAFSGHRGGISDLYIVSASGGTLQRLTDDRYGDNQPAWSPDGNSIAFATDRGPETDFGVLRYSDWKIALYHLDGRGIEVLPAQDGHNINPVWAPDGRSIAFVSSRSGIQNIFLYDFEARDAYQLTNFVGGITSFTKYSPVLSWARQADRLAFTYFEDGDYTVWAIDNPRLLKREPYRPAPRALVAQAPAAPADSVATVARAPDPAPVPGVQSLYRSPTGIRPSGDTPQLSERSQSNEPVSVAALLDSAALALPDTTRFRGYNYRVRFSPDYIARPSIGYTRDNFGRGVFGGTTIILSDLLGNHSLAFAGEVNGRISEARVFAGFTNLSRRFQYTTGIFQEPFFFAQGYSARPYDPSGSEWVEEIVYTRYLQRQIFGIGIYPLNRFTRFEYGLRLTNLERDDFIVQQLVTPGGTPISNAAIVDEIHGPAVYMAQPSLAYVSDNTLFGLTGPIMGRRYRFEVQPTAGSYQWMGYTADYRRYDPILFNFLTVATRALVSVNAGRDADSLRSYIGYPELVRGYDRETYPVDPSSCARYQTGEQFKCAPLFGSRVAIANAELRFPLLRRLDLGIIPIGLPPIEGVTFFDAALAWYSGQKVELKGYNPADGEIDPSEIRHLMRSYGAGIRVNLFNFALLRWDYAIPLDGPRRKNGYWRFSIAPSF